MLRTNGKGFAEDLVQVVQRWKISRVAVWKRLVRSRNGLCAQALGVVLLYGEDLTQNRCHLKALQAPLKSLACFDGSIPLKPGLFHLCGKMTSLRRSGEDGVFIIEGFHGYWSPLDYAKTKTKFSHQSQAKQRRTDAPSGGEDPQAMDRRSLGRVRRGTEKETGDREHRSLFLSL